MLGRRIVGVGAVALVLSACGLQMRTTEIARPYAPLPPSAPVQVMSVGVPQCPFEELELVTVWESLDVHGDAMLFWMKDEARRVGGHALLGLREIYKDEGKDRGLTATVVRYSEPGCLG